MGFRSFPEKVVQMRQSTCLEACSISDLIALTRALEPWSLLPCGTSALLTVEEVHMPDQQVAGVVAALSLLIDYIVPRYAGCRVHRCTSSNKNNSSSSRSRSSHTQQRALARLPLQPTSVAARRPHQHPSESQTQNLNQGPGVSGVSNSRSPHY